MIGNNLGNFSTPSLNGRAKRKATGGSSSVLLIEDSPLQAIKLKLSLENNGCRVHWADTGWGGLALVEEEAFDLIVLDIELPDINGFQVCQRLKNNTEVAGIPIIMLTMHDHVEDVLNGLELGVVDYIPKDAFAEAVLLETIQQMRQGRSMTSPTTVVS